jgi:hypothetical protein
MGMLGACPLPSLSWPFRHLLLVLEGPWLLDVDFCFFSYLILNLWLNVLASTFCKLLFLILLIPMVLSKVPTDLRCWIGMPDDM